MTITVLKAGLETTVQDYPGRQGMLRDGVPPSGPLDDWSFRLANLLVGNEPGAAALECAFLGPALCFDVPATIAVCGGDLSATLDAAPFPLWTAVRVDAGQFSHSAAQGLERGLMLRLRARSTCRWRWVRARPM